MNHWLEPSERTAENALIVFRCAFTLEHDSVLPVAFSADERAQLFLDGERIAEGPERGCPERWHLARFMLRASRGKHVLTARVLQFHIKCAYAQMSVRHGFYFDDPSGTLRNWEWKESPGLEFIVPFPDWGSFPRVKVSRNYDSGILSGAGTGWKSAAFFEDSRTLHEPELPPVDYAEIQPDSFDGTTFHFNHYVLAYMVLRFTGTGTARVRWTETPYRSETFDQLSLKGDKGSRDGTHFIGNGDEFEINGGLEWQSFWWRAGHYMRLETTGNVRCEVKFYRTGYPYVFPETDSPLMQAAFETLRNCSFETYMDCPYYEQLLYAGDARLEMLSTYSFTNDHRLAAKCLRLLILSQRPDGSILSQYPSRSIQVIPSYMAIWILTYGDWVRVHGMDSLAEELFPKAGKLMDYLNSCIGADGLARIPGWDFIDWCGAWPNGIPPCGKGEPESILNLFLVLAFQSFAEVSHKSVWSDRAGALRKRIEERYYVPERGLLAVDLRKTHFSEHPQVLAILAGSTLPLGKSLERCMGLVPCSIYFSYYYLAACEKAGLDDLFRERMRKFESLPGQGLTTLPEEFEDPRSDCHAWSSHILCFRNSPIVNADAART